MKKWEQRSHRQGVGEEQVVGSMRGMHPLLQDFDFWQCINVLYFKKVKLNQQVWEGRKIVKFKVS